MQNPCGSLTIGWRVDDDGHPAYWLQSGATAGGHSAADLVCIPAHQAAKHTGIIAQSGSGKSFFLGRLVEEILLNTRAKVFIFDPNADFRNFGSVQTSMWGKSGYDRATSMGMLPTEATPEQVAAAWRALPKKVLRGDIAQPDGDFLPMQIWWPLLSMDLIAEDLGPAERVELRHCHTFLQSLAALLAPRLESAAVRSDDANLLLDVSQEALAQLGAARQSGVSTRAELRGILSAAIGVPNQGRELDRALSSAIYVSQTVAQYYYACARECQIAGIVRNAPPPDFSGFRSLVLDLPSLSSPEIRLLAVYQALTRLWAMQQQAWQEAMKHTAEEDRREPYFIVVDEAHNLIPAEPRSRAAAALRELFRTIAAEGRKFGLFLIVVSQRPDKLDSMVLSECENKIIMRIDSVDVLEKIQNTLSVSASDAGQLADCLKFGTGRGMLLGTWARGGPVRFMAAARRTVEGGRNLNANWWAHPATEKR